MVPAGWLTTINQATLGGTNVALAACPTNPTAPNPAVTGENDLFYLELKYDGQFTGMTGDTLQKNGNINQMMWRTRGRERQAYNFSYDYLDRLRSAVYADVNDAGTVTTNSRYNESLTYADARGNISNLKRVGGQISGSCWNFAQIDNLAYSYTTGTNKISSITDAASATYKAKGFNPGGGAGSYTYDANGSLKADPYKGIVNINYNHLNLPSLIDMGGNKTVTNLYDADGVKLRMTVNNNGTITTRDYLDGIEYDGNTIESIYHLEGRVFNNSGTYRYEYAIGDHLGNTRLTFTDKNGNGTIEVTNSSTNEILQENHYYPFGLNFDGPWMNDSGAADERYQFNGIERVGELGVNLDLAFFRANDPAIGRWWQVDPMVELASNWTPYRFCFNNPNIYSDPLGLFETRDEAKKYREENKIKGRVRKKEGGGFEIRHKGNDGNINTFNDAEFGVVTEVTYKERGLHIADIGIDGLNELAVANPDAYLQGTDLRDKLYVAGSIIGLASPTGRTMTVSRTAAEIAPIAQKAIVIGEGMDRVMPAARSIGAKWYQAWSKNFPAGRVMTEAELAAALSRQTRWINSKIRQGYKIYDIGPKGTKISSPFYQVERDAIRVANYPTTPLKY